MELMDIIRENMTENCNCIEDNAVLEKRVREYYKNLSFDEYKALEEEINEYEDRVLGMPAGETDIDEWPQDLQLLDDALYEARRFFEPELFDEDEYDWEEEDFEEEYDDEDDEEDFDPLYVIENMFENQWKDD